MVIMSSYLHIGAPIGNYVHHTCILTGADSTYPSCRATLVGEGDTHPAAKEADRGSVLSIGPSSSAVQFPIPQAIHETRCACMCVHVCACVCACMCPYMSVCLCVRVHDMITHMLMEVENSVRVLTVP